MQLTQQEEMWLNGDAGYATQRAMEIIVTLAKIYSADRLLPVKSVQISGVSYRNIGAAGLKFLHQWADEGARVRVHTTLNPTAMDMCRWESQGFAPDFARKQQEVMAVFKQMGVSGGEPVPTCTPYLMGNLPSFGEHIAWAESSAVSYANSVLGARTNREGGPGAIAAAITGRTGAYGLHLDRNRCATTVVEIKTRVDSVSDYSALGAVVGTATRKAVPLFRGLPLTAQDPLWREKLKALGAAMAATAAVALFHVEGITPEAIAGLTLATGYNAIVIDDVTTGYAMLSDDVKEIDLVWIGCPHASLPEIARVAERLAGSRLSIPLHITCARPVREAAVACGLVDKIEGAGGQVFTDACMAIAPVQALGFTSVATPSAKGAYYLRNLAGVAARFGSLAQCLEAAVTGIWPDVA
ncbi:MAG: aconitase X catalytic domain-containing protein [Anaerolineae bacterium]|nr:aconitase X catalytic domain-containing protein [Anaerolineae bacterium]